MPQYMVSCLKAVPAGGGDAGNVGGLGVIRPGVTIGLS